MSARQIALGTPQRIQRRRLKGWRAPAGAVYVGRGTKWGNPFTNADAIDAEWATTVAEARKVNVEFFTAWLDGTLHGGPGPEGTSWSAERRDWIRDHASELASRDLMCWCPPGEPCHADVLIEIANGATS
jgi:hypothetical protein